MSSALASSHDTQIHPIPSSKDASGRTLGAEEISLVADAIRSGNLNGNDGKYVNRLEAKFAELIGTRNGHACSSGSAGIHVAVSCADIEPGDEVITSPLANMRSITPILFQGAIPVFADVDPRTCNVTAESVSARISERTKAIIVSHQFGNPCDMDAIVELARARNCVLIEDCTHAYLAEYRGSRVGAIGDISCFSLRQDAHITTGEGGLVLTSNPEFSRHCSLFINEGWGFGDGAPDHYFAALNYRMSELQAAVGTGQLDKLADVVASRRSSASSLTQELFGMDGVEPPATTPNSTHSYSHYCLYVDGDRHKNGAIQLGDHLRENGISCKPLYKEKPAFRCDVISKQRTLGNSRWPFTLARPDAIDYSGERYAGTFKAMSNTLVLPWNENYTEQQVEFIAAAIREGVDKLT